MITQVSLGEQFDRFRKHLPSMATDYDLPTGCLDGVEEQLERFTSAQPSVVQTVLCSFGSCEELTIKLQLDMIRKRSIMFEPAPVDQRRPVEFWKSHADEEPYHPGIWVVDLVLCPERELRHQVTSKKEAGVELLAAVALYENDFIETMKNYGFSQVLAGGLHLRSDVIGRNQVVAIGRDQKMVTTWFTGKSDSPSVAIPLVSAKSCVKSFLK